MTVSLCACASVAARSLALVVATSCAPKIALASVAAIPPPSATPEAGPTRALPVVNDAAPVSELVRHDITVANGGLRDSLDEPTLQALDVVFVHRFDVYAHLHPSDAFTIWLRDGELIAAELPCGHRLLAAVLYEGDLAPRGFYDEDGLSMGGVLRARPVNIGRVTSHFGQRFDAFTGAPSFHHGVDYGVPVGTPVLAAGAGRVKAIGHSDSSGNFVVLAHAGGFESTYLHLDSIRVKLGHVVASDDVIALSGNTGRSTGPHVHYELRLAGIALDPLATLPPSTLALGPLARRQHLALIQQLQQMEDTHDRRTHQ